MRSHLELSLRKRDGGGPSMQPEPWQDGRLKDSAIFIVLHMGKNRPYAKRRLFSASSHFELHAHRQGSPWCRQVGSMSRMPAEECMPVERENVSE
ncbi:MAG: hypothetical protein ACLUEQ_11195 [Cloacibacillus evryensis]